jgi:hypothetical protein
MKECECGSAEVTSTHFLPWAGQPRDKRFKLKVEMIINCEVCEDGDRNLMFVEVISPVTSEWKFYRRGGKVHEIYLEVYPEGSDIPVCKFEDDWQEEAQEQSLLFMMREYEDLVDPDVKEDRGW